MEIDYPELYQALTDFIVSQRGHGEFGKDGRAGYENDIIGQLYFDIIETEDDPGSVDISTDSHVQDWQDWYWTQIDDLEQWDYDLDSQDHWDTYISGTEEDGYGEPIGGVYDS
jgi:hypothetical protein